MLDKTDFPPLQETCQRCKTAVNMRNVMKNCRFSLLLQIKKKDQRKKKGFFVEMNLCFIVLRFYFVRNLRTGAL